MFSISTDGSNDRKAEKPFPIVVRTVHPETFKVRSEVLAVPTVEGSASGENIFKVIETELGSHDVSCENCTSLGCDDASVMQVHASAALHPGVKNPETCEHQVAEYQQMPS